MKKEVKRTLILGMIGIILFVVWTGMILVVDVENVGVNGTGIGFATFNRWFHGLTGVHMWIYNLTDWLGLVPIFVCMIFGGIGLIQWGKRRSILKVDYDIMILGSYYVIVILAYLVFEMIPINYRPVLIEETMEVSYPSSTTLLVLCVMPTLVEQVERRVESRKFRYIMRIFALSFSVFMVVGRLLSGVHWFTDIVGAVMLSVGLFNIYKAAVWMGTKKL